MNKRRRFKAKARRASRRWSQDWMNGLRITAKSFLRRPARLEYRVAALRPELECRVYPDDSKPLYQLSPLTTDSLNWPSPLTAGAGQTGKTLTVKNCTPAAPYPDDRLVDRELGISIRFVRQYDIESDRRALRIHADGRIEKFT